MASIGHVLVGLAVAQVHDAGCAPRPLRLRVASATTFATLAMIPDLDVVAFRFGIPYGAPLGHRGAAHSLVAAVVVAAALAWPLAKEMRARVAPTFVAALVAIASHGLLDMLTDGGRGVGLLWPFSDVRWFFAWRPLPVAPIGVGFLSSRGLHCVLVELAVFVPVVVMAAGAAARRRRAGTAAPRLP